MTAWVSTHSSLTAGFVVGIGLLLRLQAGFGTFLNPDEAEHYLAANAGSLAGAYHATLNQAHPPLFVVFLFFWRQVAVSELGLRVPSIVAGAAFCWLLFKWVATVFHRTVGWIALIFAVF